MKMFTWAASSSFVAILALWTADHFRLERDGSLKSANVLKIERDSLEASNRELAYVLADNAALQEKITEISRVTQQLSMSLDQQSSLINNQMEELKRYDKKIADYLGGVVPAELGLQYARSETTDPLLYRTGGVSMPFSPVSSAGPRTAETQ